MAARTTPHRPPKRTTRDKQRTCCVSSRASGPALLIAKLKSERGMQVEFGRLGRSGHDPANAGDIASPPASPPRSAHASACRWWWKRSSKVVEALVGTDWAASRRPSSVTVLCQLRLPTAARRRPTKIHCSKQITPSRY